MRGRTSRTGGCSQSIPLAQSPADPILPVPRLKPRRPEDPGDRPRRRHPHPRVPRRGATVGAGSSTSPGRPPSATAPGPAQRRRSSDARSGAGGRDRRESFRLLQRLEALYGLDPHFRFLPSSSNNRSCGGPSRRGKERSLSSSFRPTVS